MPGLAPNAAAHAGSERSLATLRRRHGNSTGTIPRYSTGCPPPTIPPTSGPTGTHPRLSPRTAAPDPVLDPSAGGSWWWWWWRGPRLGLPPSWECAALSTAGPRASPERHRQRSQASGLPVTPRQHPTGTPATHQRCPPASPSPCPNTPHSPQPPPGGSPRPAGSPSLSCPQSRPFKKSHKRNKQGFRVWASSADSLSPAGGAEPPLWAPPPSAPATGAPCVPRGEAEFVPGLCLFAIFLHTRSGGGCRRGPAGSVAVESGGEARGGEGSPRPDRAE